MAAAFGSKQSIIKTLKKPQRPYRNPVNKWMMAHLNQGTYGNTAVGSHEFP